MCFIHCPPLLFPFQQHQQTLLNQLREVTGTTDIQLLQQALQVHYGKLALQILISELTRTVNKQ